MILRISVNLVKFCVSEVDEFWWNYFYFAWRKRGGGERGVVDGTPLSLLLDNLSMRKIVSPRCYWPGFCDSRESTSIAEPRPIWPKQLRMQHYLTWQPDT
jgi:hypothetical protein